MTSAPKTRLKILADGQELQAIETIGGKADAGGERRVERVPDQIVQMSTVSRAGRVSPGGGISTCSRARNTTVPKTRRIGCAKLMAVYCVAGLASG